MNGQRIFTKCSTNIDKMSSTKWSTVNVLVNEFFKIGVAISLPLSYNQERPQPKGQQNT